MAKIDVAFKITKDKRSRKQHLIQLSVNSIAIADDSDSELGLTNLLMNPCKKVPLTSRCCYCREPKEPAQMTYSKSWGFRLLIARYATVAIIPMLLLLAPVQAVDRGTSDSLSVNTNYNALDVSNNSSLNINLTQSSMRTENVSEKFPNTNKVSNRRINKDENMSSGPGVVSGIHGVSMNRNNLIDGDNTLQRQLRQKAKLDSLQSIKMHILMRLNLKKLPNITKPISVPQNILESFYKKYNASLLNSMWRHDTPLRTGLYASGEFVTEPKTTLSNSTENSQQYIHNAQSSTSSNDDNSSVENSSAEMQGDDPNVFEDYQFLYNIGFNDNQQPNFDTHGTSEFNINDDNGEYESILSHISSIYVFPEQPHMRHSRKTEVLRFKFDTSYSEISYVTLHLYLRGLDWIRNNQPNIIKEIEDDQNKEIIVAVHRALRRVNTTNYTHKMKMFEFRHKIPRGLGQWVSVDLKPLFVTGMVSQGPNKTQEIFIKGVESWMKPLVVTTDNTSKNPLTVHIEIGSHKKHRRKRSVFLDCTESDHDMRCCRYPLKVNFTSFGWHFVVAPTSFDAYFCSGDCRVGYLEQYPHTHLAALTTSASPCCSPTKMSSLSLLYFDDNHNLVLSVIPNMSVEGCSCS